jgi:hypothetical protein
MLMSVNASKTGVRSTARASAVIIARSDSPPMPVEKVTGWSKRASSGSSAGCASAAPSARHATAKNVRRVRERFMVTA